MLHVTLDAKYLRPGVANFPTSVEVIFYSCRDGMDARCLQRSSLSCLAHKLSGTCLSLLVELVYAMVGALVGMYFALGFRLAVYFWNGEGFYLVLEVRMVVAFGVAAGAVVSPHFDVFSRSLAPFVSCSLAHHGFVWIQLLPPFHVASNYWIRCTLVVGWGFCGWWCWC